MKLKTLKDFESIELIKGKWQEGKIDGNKLRQEAIKWVKKYGYKLEQEEFMEFLNITEEDLK